MIPNNPRDDGGLASARPSLVDLVKETVNIMRQLQHVVIMDDRDIERDVLGPFDTAAEAEEYAARLGVFVQSSGSMHAVYVSVEPLLAPPEDPTDMFEAPDEEDEEPRDPSNAFEALESPMTTWKAGDPRFTRGPVEPGTSEPSEAPQNPPRRSQNDSGSSLERLLGDSWDVRHLHGTIGA